MSPTPLNINFGRPQPITPPPVVDVFGNIKSSVGDGLASIQGFSSKATESLKKFTGESVKNLQSFTFGLNTVEKAAITTTKSVQAAELGINLFGSTLKGTTKELFLVGSAVGVLTGTFFQFQQQSQLAIIPLKGIADALEAVNKKQEGVDLANQLGIDTTAIQQLDLFRAGIFGNTQALDVFRKSSQTVGLDFQLNLTKLNTILKQSKKGIADVGQQARRLSKDLGGTVSSSDIIAGQYQIASGGFTKGSDSKKVAEASAKLSVVGFNDFFSTADLITKSLRAYGLEASKAGEIAGKLNAVVEVGITTIPELAAGFSETAVTAKAFGIDLNQLGAAVATITTQGSSTPEALTGIEALFRTLANQTPQAVKALGELSLNGEKVKFDLATVQSKGLGTALNDLFTAAKGNVSVLREIIPESRALQAALALAAQGGSLFASSLEAVTAAGSINLDELFGQVKEDPTIKLRAISTSAKELVGSIGEGYSSFGEEATKGLANFVSATENLSNLPGLKQIIQGGLVIGDIFGKAVGVFGAFASAGIGVVTTLASINLFNNLFNPKGLLEQGRLIKNSIVDIGDYGNALKQVVGIDTTKDVTNGLQNKISGLQSKLEITTDPTTTTRIKSEIDALQTRIVEFQQIARKPIDLTVTNIEQTVEEIKALEVEIQKLKAEAALLPEGSTDRKAIEEKTSNRVSQQNEKVSDLGKKKFEQEGLLAKNIKSGNIDAAEAESYRKITNDKIAEGAVLSPTNPRSLANAKLEEAKNQAQVLNANATKAERDVAAARINKARIDLDRTAITKPNPIAVGAANTFRFFTTGIFQPRDKGDALNRAQDLASSSQAVDNLGAALNKVKDVSIKGIGLGLKGLEAGVKGLAGLGIGLIQTFLNPLALLAGGIAIIAGFVESSNRANALAAGFAQSELDYETRKKAAIQNTTKALEDQVKIKSLLAAGFTQDEAKNRVTEDNKLSTLKTALNSGNLTDSSKAVVQKQINAKDFRTADEFLKDKSIEIRNNKFGIGDDNGLQVRTDQSNALRASAGITAGVAIGGAIAAGFTAAVGGASAGLGILIGAAIGGAIGLAVTSVLDNISAKKQADEVKQEYLDRRRVELEAKFKPNEAATGVERIQRLKKINEGVEASRSTADFVAATTGQNDSIFQNLQSNGFFGIGASPETAKIKTGAKAYSDKLKEIKGENDIALKGITDGSIEAGLFDPEISKKLTETLRGKAQISTDDLSIVDATLKGRIEAINGLKEEAAKLAEEAVDPKTKTLFKAQSEALSLEVDKVNKVKEELRKKVSTKNSDILNQTRNVGGAVQAISTTESASAIAQVTKIKEALESGDSRLSSQVPSYIEALGSSLETLKQVNPQKAEDVAKTAKTLLDLKDKNGNLLSSIIDPKPLLALINTVGTAAGSTAEIEIIRLESAAKRLSGLASNTSVAGSSVGKESINDLNVKTIEQKIIAQQQLFEAQTIPKQKEIALNELIQLQVDKQNATIQARLEKELAATELLYNLEKSRLNLKQTAVDNRASVFGDFGIDNRKDINESFNLRQKALQDEAKKQREDLQKQQDASIEQSKASDPRLIERNIRLAKVDSDNPITNTNQVTLESKAAAIRKEIEDERDKKIKEAESLAAPFASQALDVQKKFIQDQKSRGIEYNAGNAGEIASDFNERRNEELSRNRGNIQQQYANAIKKLNDAKTAGLINATEKDANISNQNRAKIKDDIVSDSQKEISKSDSAETQEVRRRNAIQKETVENEILARKKQLDFEEQKAQYQAILAVITPISQALQESLTATIATITPLKQIDSVYISQANSLGLIKTQSSLQKVAAIETYELEKQKLDLQKQVLINSGNYTAEARQTLERKNKQLDNQLQSQIITLQFAAKQESIDAIAKKLQSTLETKLKTLNLSKSALDTFVGSFSSDDADSKEAINAKRAAGELGIQIAIQQAAFDVQSVKIQQAKNKFVLEETQLKLKLLDIDLQFKETEAKTPEQKKAIQDARKDIKNLRDNVDSQIKEQPAQNAAQLALVQQQGGLAVDTAVINNAKENGTPLDLSMAQRAFASKNLAQYKLYDGDIASPLNINYKPTSIKQGTAGFNQALAISDKAYNDAAGSDEKQPQQRSTTPILNSDGSITQADTFNNIRPTYESLQQSYSNNGGNTQQTQPANLTPTVILTVNGNGDPTAISKAVSQSLLEVTRKFQQ